MKSLKYLTIAFFALACVSTASAQSLTGTLSGLVKDDQGGVLPGVAVTLTGKTGGRQAVTDASGTYRFVAIDPGSYSVEATLAGFERRRYPSVAVTIGKTTTIDFSMKAGGFTDVVDVVGDAPVVDVTSSSTDNSLNQEFLFNLPISRTNAAVNTLNYFPGVNSGSAYGGDADSGNALMLDGVDTRDPEAGTAWTFFNYNIIEEVQVGGLGAPAEFGSFTGAFVNTITKSGGNRHSALFDVNFTNDSSVFSSNNVDPEVARQNPALKEPAKTTKLLDITGQFSGPLIRDKLFFFGSAQRYKRVSDPTGPVTKRDEVSPRLNGKLTWIPGAKDNVMLMIQADDYNIIGRPGVPALLADDTLTNREDAPEYVWSLQWKHTFGANTFLDAKYLGWWGYFDLNPEVNKSGRFDAETGKYSVSQGWFYYADRGRNQVNASITHYAQGFGNHELKFGVELERSKVRSRYGYLNDVFYYDYGGQPYYAYNYGYDLDGGNKRESVYVQDSWKVNDRLTLNPGIRMDAVRGVPKDGNKVYDVKQIAPRFGFAFDLTGDQKTVVKGFYGRYYEGAFFQAWSGAIPGFKDFVGWDLSGCASIANCPRSRWEEVTRYVYPQYKVDPDIKHPRVDEFHFGLERQLGNQFRLSLTGVWRDDKNVIGTVLPSARWAPVTLTTSATTPASGFPVRSVGAFRWTNRTASDRDVLITNPDGFQYRDAAGNVLGTARGEQKYRAFMAVLQKRMSNRWQAQLSYVYSKTTGTIGNGSGATLGGASFSRTYQLPNASLVNTDGPLTNDRPHEVKFYATYEVPKVEASLNILYRGYSGRPYAANQRFSSSAVAGHGFPFGAGRTIFVEPRGSQRLEFEHNLDLRVEKVFKFGGRSDRVAVYADVFNALNKGTVTARQARVPNISIAGLDDPVQFNAPTGLVTARQVQLGARWSF